MGFPRIEYWSGLPCPPPGDLLDQEWNRGLLNCRWILYQLSYKRSPRILEWVDYLFSRGLPDPGIKPGSPELQVDSLPTELSGKPFSRKGFIITKKLSVWSYITSRKNNYTSIWQEALWMFRKQKHSEIKTFKEPSCSNNWTSKLFSSVQFSCSVMSNSLRSHGL